jgi:hypothetical protein
MALKIYKYPIEVIDSQELKLPKGARILTLQTQHDVPYIWAMVNPDEKRTERWQFVTHGTGHDVTPDIAMFTHLSTYQLQGGAFVFHAFFRRVS